MSAHSGEDKMSVENMWLLFACVVMCAFSYAFLKPMCTCSCRKKPPPPPVPEPVAEVKVIKIHPARANFRLFPPGEAYYLGGPPRKPVEPKAKKKPKVKDKLNAKWRQCVNTIITNNAIRDLSTQLPIRAFSKDKDDKENDETQDPSTQINTADDNYIVRDPNVFSGLPTTANNCCGSYSNGGGTMNDFARLVQLARAIEKRKEQEQEKALEDAEAAKKIKDEEKDKNNIKKSPLQKDQNIAYMDDELGEDEIRPAPPNHYPNKPPQQPHSHPSQNVQIPKPRKQIIKPNPKINPVPDPCPQPMGMGVPDPEPGPSKFQLQSQSQQAKYIGPLTRRADVSSSSTDSATTVVEIRDEVNVQNLKRGTMRHLEDELNGDRDQDKMRRMPIKRLVQESVDEKYHNYTNYAYVSSTTDLRSPAGQDHKTENHSHGRVIMTSSSTRSEFDPTPHQQPHPHQNFESSKTKNIENSEVELPQFPEDSQINPKRQHLNYPHEQLHLSQSQPTIINVSPSAATAAQTKRY